MVTSSAAALRPAARKAQAAPRDLRNQALADVRRQSVLDAAHSAFFELGMEKTSMREIAQRAGYTVGALYSYLANKEEVYGARPPRSSTSIVRIRAISTSASTFSRA